MQIVYQEADLDLVRLIDPLSERTVDLLTLPSTIKAETQGSLRVFSDLPFHLRTRVFYNSVSRKLGFKGYLDESGAGDPLLLPNIMSRKEFDLLRGLSTNTAYRSALNQLYALTIEPNDPVGLIGRTKALTAGAAEGTGYVTLAFNNSASLSPLPVSLSILRVAEPVYIGEIKVIQSDNLFDEQLTLRHSGDFGGTPDNIYVDWWYHPDVTGFPPTTRPGDGNPVNLWQRLDDKSGIGAVDLTISGSSILTISDNWFYVRYSGLQAGDNRDPGYDYQNGGGVPDTDYFSPWAGSPGGTLLRPRPQLAEGWIKRVVNGLNPFESRVKDFHKTPTNTTTSMLMQAGHRYEGPIAMSADPDVLNSLGLIEAYQTVLERGMSLSIEGTPPINYGPANTALLNAATRIAELYVLLGNEAYADASDPTIGFTTASGEYGNLASSLFTFQNQLSSLLDEELVLLRGRDDVQAPVAAQPVYNRLFWNFTNGDGELAYAMSYNITDQNDDGVINELDAKLMYPQGHGDAWGHYLMAIKTQYRLLRHPNYTWSPRAESVLVAGVPVLVDYLDERKFARFAAAKAKCGAEIVDLTYRGHYVDDPAGQWQGYKDTEQDTPSDPDSKRAWGLSEWGRRAGMGAYFDWVTANALVPDEDPNPDHEGIAKIDRSTVTEIGDIAVQFNKIQAKVTQADTGLNPLGLAKGVVPFDIDPSQIDAGKTHFEQVYDRAVDAMENAVTVFDHVNQMSQMLRLNQDSSTDFTRNVQDQERDYVNRLIEIFGYPYAEDIGPGGTYPTGYEGADIYHYMYTDATELTGDTAPELGAQEIRTYFKQMPNGSFGISLDGNTDEEAFDPDGDGITEVTYTISLNGFDFIKRDGWTARRAPGELQQILSDLHQARARYQQAVVNYENLLTRINVQVGDIQAQHAQNQLTLNIMDDHRDTITGMNKAIGVLNGTAMALREVNAWTNRISESTIEFLPTVVGFACDPSFVARGAIKTTTGVVEQLLDTAANASEFAASAVELGKEGVDLQTEIRLEEEGMKYELASMVGDLEAMIREEPVLRMECYSLKEVVAQTMGEYQAKLAEGERLMQELSTFRRQTASDVQQYRYQDMAFRIFRNDALQKYRAQFDMAARYVYLAATAYDYELNLLGSASGSGRGFVTDIVRQRALGQMSSGVPVAGAPGLADPLARLNQNFQVYKTQLGFNNPQTETSRFSLRQELFRLKDESDGEWRAVLEQHRVPNIWDLPEFRRYCRPFTLESQGPQPAIVVRFPTTVTFGLNFFGWPLGGGDSAYDPTYFATKIRSVGVWFTNYNGSGLSKTPRVYLIPVGIDILRSPSAYDFQTREWRVVDQCLPVPYPIGSSDMNDPGWMPMFDSLSGTFSEIRRFSSLRAYHDSGDFNPSEAISNSRLIGRSVWNSQWMLVIPGGTLLFDPDDGLDTFIHGKVIGPSGERDENGVSDIKVFFQTYAYSGN